MGKIIESEGLKLHPIEAPEYYNRSSFDERMVYRLGSVGFLLGLRDLGKVAGLNKPKEDIDLLFFLDPFLRGEGKKEETQMMGLVKYLRNIEPETASNFLRCSFGRNRDEEMEFVPNGEEIGCLLSDILVNNWFKPKTPLSREDLEARVKEMGGIYNFNITSVEETPWLDEAVDARSSYGELSTASKDHKERDMGDVRWDDKRRIGEIVEKLAKEAYDKLYPKVKKSFKERLVKRLKMRLFPLTTFAETWGEVIKRPNPIERVREQLGGNIGFFVEYFSSYLIKQVMRESRKDFEKTIKEGDGFPGRDRYETFYSYIMARDIGGNLGEYAKYLVVKDILPPEGRHCFLEDLWNFHKQGYWFAGFSEKDDGSKDAVFWHL